jgi:two-component system alkaline phosphatase synthesis response regulator PhoP
MGDKRKIFIADDDEEISQLLKKTLIARGFEAEATHHSKDVFPMIKAFKPDLILLDLLMPDLGGFEICEMLNRDKETQGLPIIVISGLIDSPDIKKAYKLGVVGYFMKPLDLKNLVREINKALAYK